MISVRTQQFLAKALRMVLVFVLTFGMTLHVEYLAFAAPTESTAVSGNTSGGSGSTSTESGNTSSETDTGGNTSGTDEESDGGDDEGGTSGTDEGGNTGESGSSSTESETESTSGSDDEEESSSTSGSEELPEELQAGDTILDIMVYLPDEDDHSIPGYEIQTVRDTAGGKAQREHPSIDKQKGSASYLAKLLVEDADGVTREVKSDKIVEWSVEDTDLAKVEDKKVGVLSATAAGNGTVTMTCGLADSYRSQLDANFASEYPGEPFQVSFDVSIENQMTVYVTSVEILKKDGSKFGDDEVLTVDDMEDGTYSFQAEVAVIDATDGDTPHTYRCTPTEGLAALTQADVDTGKLPVALHDLVWSVSTEGATIDAMGAFKLNDVPEASVSCYSTEGLEGAVPPDVVTIQGVQPVDPEPKESPYVKSIEILDKDGNPIPNGGSIDIPVGSKGSGSSGSSAAEVSSSSSGVATQADEASGAEGAGAGDASSSSSAAGQQVEPVSYQFGARVTVTDPETGRDKVYIFDGTSSAPSGEGSSSSSSASADASEASEASSSSLAAQADGDAEGTDEDGEASGADGLSSSSSSASADGADGSEGSGSSSSASGGSESSSSSASGDVEAAFSIHWEATSEDSIAISQNGLLTLNSGKPAVVTCYSTDGQEGARVEATVTVNPNGESMDDVPEGIFLDYKPVPYGEAALVTLNISKIRNITFIIHWEEWDEERGAWVETEPELGKGFSGAQYLTRPTVEPYIGKRYRAYIDIIAGSDQYNVQPTEPVTIQIGEDKLRVDLYLQNAPENGYAKFTTSVRGLKDTAGQKASDVKYTWVEVNKETGKVTELASGYLPTYDMLVTSANLANRYLVRISTPDGETAESNVITLTATVPGAGTDDDGKDNEGSGSSSASGSEGGSSDSGGGATPVPTPSPTPPSDDTTDTSDTDNTDSTSGNTDASDTPADPNAGNTEPVKEPTLSERVDQQGSAAISFDDGTSATMKPVGSVTMADEQKQTASTTPNEARPDVEVNAQVNQDIAEAQAQQREAEMSSQPGLRWNPIYFTEAPKPEDALANNMLAPFVLPFCLAVLAAGALEKFLRFREQKRQSQAAF